MEGTSLRSGSRCPSLSRVRDADLCASAQLPALLCPSPALSLSAWNSHTPDELLCILHTPVQMFFSAEPSQWPGCVAPTGPGEAPQCPLWGTSTALCSPAVHESERLGA